MTPVFRLAECPGLSKAFLNSVSWVTALASAARQEMVNVSFFYLSFIALADCEVLGLLMTLET